jgi:molybdopterin converting factor small subunit
VRQRKVASPRQETATLTLGLSPELRDGLKRLSAVRKAARQAGRPIFIQGMVDDAIVNLAQMLNSGKEVAFIPVPRCSEGRTALRVSAQAHRTAQKASEAADVKLADYIRTALSLYLRNHANEIDKEAKAPRHRA